MALRLSLLSEHFHNISTPASPRPVNLSHLFGGGSTGDPQAGDTGLSEQVRQLALEVNQQGELVGEVASALSGKGGDLASAGSSLLGGSVLGGLAGAASSGFSWQSVLKDVFPLGGLVSDIAGLFSSPAATPPTEQYDAPMPLAFSGVLGSDGSISQAAGNAAGQDRAASPGLNLTDAAGGPQSAYTRLSDGLLGPSAGDASNRYSGVLNLSSEVRGLVSDTAPAASPSPTPGSGAQTVAPPQSTGTGSAIAPGTASASTSGDAANTVPTFDGPWFMDHAPYIAAAVRTAMLDYHPIVDVVNAL